MKLRKITKTKDYVDQTYLLLINLSRSVITGKSQTSALMYVLTSRHQGRGLRFPCNDRTGEVNKLFIIWPFLVLFLKRIQQKHRK